MQSKTILAIETSCDETAAAVLECHKSKNNYEINVLSNVVASQVDIHKQWGGVYPELASRAHLEAMIPVIEEAVVPIGDKKQDTSNKIQKNIDAIAVTVGPGLIGSLLMGVETAQILASYFNKPVIPVNHLEGHIYTAFAANNKFLISDDQSIFPILALIVSGGHTSLAVIDKHLSYKTVGQTIDDAAGEAFDKVARILELGYPGGPAIEHLASRGDENTYKLPLSMVKSNDLNFSFSGLKTAVLYLTKNPATGLARKYSKTDLAASFQKTVAEILTQKTISALKKFGPKTVILSGGVSANSYLRKHFVSEISNLSTILIPPKQLSTDNAVGIGIAGAIKYIEDQSTHWSKIDAMANSSIDSANFLN